MISFRHRMIAVAVALAGLAIYVLIMSGPAGVTGPPLPKESGTAPFPTSLESKPVDSGRPSGPLEKRVSRHLQLGNPTKARPDPAERLNFLMEKDQFALSYNDKRGTPNWVSYHLRRSDMGRAPRPEGFFPDEDLPPGFHRVRPGDFHFQRTGMTRGHLCPSSHRNNTEANSRATFVMTNMIPQSEELNGGAWEQLESYCRDLCFRSRKQMWIVCGPHGMGGVTARGKFLNIADGRVTVPRNCWKVVLIADDRPGEPASLINGASRLIAVVMPNTREPDENVPWTRYLVSASDVEALTGYRFFDALPAEIIEPLKKKVDAPPDGGRIGDR